MFILLILLIFKSSQLSSVKQFHIFLMNLGPTPTDCSSLLQCLQRRYIYCAVQVQSAVVTISFLCLYTSCQTHFLHAWTIPSPHGLCTVMPCFIFIYTTCLPCQFYPYAICLSCLYHAYALCLPHQLHYYIYSVVDYLVPQLVFARILFAFYLAFSNQLRQYQHLLALLLAHRYRTRRLWNYCLATTCLVV